MTNRLVNCFRMLAGTSFTASSLPEDSSQNDNKEKFPWLKEILTEEELEFLLSDLVEENLPGK